MTTVIFACVHNAGRSPMAAAFFGALADPAQARATRDAVRARVATFMRTRGWAR